MSDGPYGRHGFNANAGYGGQAGGASYGNSQQGGGGGYAAPSYGQAYGGGGASYGASGGQDYGAQYGSYGGGAPDNYQVRRGRTPCIDTHSKSSFRFDFRSVVMVIDLFSLILTGSQSVIHEIPSGTEILCGSQRGFVAQRNV